MKGRIYAVHYGEDRSVTLDFLRSMGRFLGADLSLVLVNNGPTGLFEDCLFASVTFLDSGRNLGYFGGVAFGMTQVPVDGLDYVMVCNNDIELTSDDFFQVLALKLNDWDVVAPSTRTLDGVEQNPHRSCKPSLARKMYARLFYSNYGLGALFNWLWEIKAKWKAARQDLPVERAIFSPHGACMVLKSSFFERGGSLEHPLLLYGEEDSVAAQAYRMGLKVGFVPELKVKHLEGSSVGKKFTRSKFEHHKAANRYIRSTYPKLF